MTKIHQDNYLTQFDSESAEAEKLKKLFQSLFCKNLASELQGNTQVRENEETKQDEKKNQFQQKSLEEISFWVSKDKPRFEPKQRRKKRHHEKTSNVIRPNVD